MGEIDVLYGVILAARPDLDTLLRIVGFATSTFAKNGFPALSSNDVEWYCGLVT